MSIQNSLWKYLLKCPSSINDNLIITINNISNTVVTIDSTVKIISHILANVRYGSNLPNVLYLPHPLFLLDVPLQLRTQYKRIGLFILSDSIIQSRAEISLHISSVFSQFNVVIPTVICKNEYELLHSLIRSQYYLIITDDLTIVILCIISSIPFIIFSQDVLVKCFIDEVFLSFYHHNGEITSDNIIKELSLVIPVLSDDYNSGYNIFLTSCKYYRNRCRFLLDNFSYSDLIIEDNHDSVLCNTYFIDGLPIRYSWRGEIRGVNDSLLYNKIFLQSIVTCYELSVNMNTLLWIQNSHIVQYAENVKFNILCDKLEVFIMEKFLNNEDRSLIQIGEYNDSNDIPLSQCNSPYMNKTIISRDDAQYDEILSKNIIYFGELHEGNLKYVLYEAIIRCTPIILFRSEKVERILNSQKKKNKKNNKYKNRYPLFLDIIENLPVMLTEKKIRKAHKILVKIKRFYFNNSLNESMSKFHLSRWELSWM